MSITNLIQTLSGITIPIQFQFIVYIIEYTWWLVLLITVLNLVLYPFRLGKR